VKNWGAGIKVRRGVVKAGRARTAACSLLLALAACGHIRAQQNETQSLSPGSGQPPSFEVATIKPSQGNGPTNYGIAEGRLRADNATLAELIRLAYGLKTGDQLEKGPEWTNSELFDMNAKVADADAVALQKLPPAQRFEQYRLMLRSLLADRFKLKVSAHEKVLPVYALVVAGNGPRVTATPPGTQHMPFLWGGSRGDLNAASVSMGFFADWLSGRADAGGRLVVDKTGLNGIYDFTLKWAADGAAGTLPDSSIGAQAPAGHGIDATGPSLLAALQEQLGLKLEPQKASVEVLVIDHVEKPSPN
jgi:uncharacterized protein (TIGR03435 family)